MFTEEQIQSYLKKIENKLLKNENKKRVILTNEWIKKFSTETLINIFIFCLMLFSSPVYAEEHNWVYVGEIKGDLWLVDTDSITCKENICSVWVKILSREYVKKLSIEKEEYSKSLLEYNCTWLEYQIVHTTKYDSNGNVISSTSSTEPGRKQIVPKSISKELYDLVCKKTSHQKEQQNTDEKVIKKSAQEAQKSAVGKGETEKVKESAKQFQQAPVPPKKIMSPRETQKDKKDKKEKFPRLQKPSGAVFTVQVGVFKNASNAKSLKTMLNKKGYNAKIITSKSKKEGNLYKVWMGKFGDREKAKILSEKIKKTEGLQAFVIVVR
jgi:cell division septation protein DedD